MSNERAKFEEWCREKMLCDPENLERLTGGRGSYRVHNVQCWWMGWQASRVAALEEVVELTKTRGHYHSLVGAIRSLAEAPTKEK